MKLLILFQTIDMEQALGMGSKAWVKFRIALRKAQACGLTWLISKAGSSPHIQDFIGLKLALWSGLSTIFTGSESWRLKAWTRLGLEKSELVLSLADSVWFS